jgi:coenzyme F420 hydrogenase subunit beta
MRMNPTKREDFVDPVAMVIGLFCTWALDQQRFVSLLKGKVDLETIVKCHIPPPPAEVFEIYTDNGTLAVPLGEVRPLVPNGCAYCTDMTSEFADVAVGMMEGASDMNTLIVRTDRGETLVRSAAEHEYVVLSELPGETLSHLREAALAKKARAFKRAVDEGMVNTQGEGKRSCYRVNAATLEHIVS